MEELRESKGLENDVKLLIQKKMALQEENEKLREELNKNLLEGAVGDAAPSKSEVEELMLINSTLNEQIKALSDKLTTERKKYQNELAQYKKKTS